MAFVRVAPRGLQEDALVLRVFLKSRVDFNFASGIKERRESNVSSRPNASRPHVVAVTYFEQLSHDPSHWAAALCVGVHAGIEVAAIGAARRGTRQSTECPVAPPPVASTTRRSSGRAGRLPGDTAVSVTTAAAVLIRCAYGRRPCFINPGGPISRCRANHRSPFLGGSIDRRRGECSSRRVCRSQTSCRFAGLKRVSIVARKER